MIRMQEEPKNIRSLRRDNWRCNESSLDSADFSNLVYQKRAYLGAAQAGLKAEAGTPISVRYDGQIVGAFTAEFVS